MNRKDKKGNTEETTGKMKSYPAQVAEALRGRGTNVDFQNLAISGSTPDQWLIGRFKSRLTQVIRDRPNLITVTLGANDLLNLLNPFKACFASEICAARSFGSPFVLHRLLADLHKQLPSTQIVVTTYHSLTIDPLGAINYLNIEVALAAAGFGPQVRVAEVPSFLGRGCGSPQTWMLGPQDLCLHPNEAGQQQYANAVLGAVAGRYLASPISLALNLQALDTVFNIALPGITQINKVGTLALKVASLAPKYVKQFVFTFVPGGARKVSAASAGPPRGIRIVVRPRYHAGIATIRVRVPKALAGKQFRVYLSVGRTPIDCAGKAKGRTKHCQRVQLSPPRLVVTSTTPASTTKPQPPSGTGSPPQQPQPPVIGQTSTYTNGVLVWLVVPYRDPNNDAAGFGFVGVNGSGWAQQVSPFSNPGPYVRVFSDRIEIPFNHACGTTSQYESDVKAWIYDSTGLQSNPVVVHLTCGGTLQ